MGVIGFVLLLLGLDDFWGESDEGGSKEDQNDKNPPLLDLCKFNTSGG